MRPPLKIVVVGAGISGLALAYRLQCRMPAAEITVLEQSERVGGTIGIVERDGFRFETGPNGFLDSKPSTIDLCGTLGLGDRLLAASEAAGKNRFLLLDGELRRLPTGLGSFFASPLLTWRGKINFLLERFRARGTGADESIAAFARRRAGREVAETFADAMVTGIFAGDPEILSLPACFPRVAALEREYGSVQRGLAKTAQRRRQEARQRSQPHRRPGQMWSFAAGLRVLPETLAARLDRPVITGVQVRRLKRGPGPAGWIVHADGADLWMADELVLACPAHQQATLLAEADAELAKRAQAIPYNRIAVVALGYRRGDISGSVDGFGFIAPQHTRRDILGVQWCSSIFPQRAPDGMVLLRALCGGWQRPEVVGWDDDRLVAGVRGELALAMKISAAPVFHHIVRWERAIPQYHVGHLERLAWIDERLRALPGLTLAGNAYRGVAINDCTEQGELLAERIAQRLREAS